MAEEGDSAQEILAEYGDWETIGEEQYYQRIYGLLAWIRDHIDQGDTDQAWELLKETDKLIGSGAARFPGTHADRMSQVDPFLNEIHRRLIEAQPDAAPEEG